MVKELIYQATVYVGKKQNSQLLIANAWHHRSDAISSVIALIGVLLSQLGFTYFDALAGITVALLIIKIGGQSCWQSFKVPF